MQTTHTWFCKTWTVNTRGNESKFVEWNICYVFRPWCVCVKWELSLVEAFFCCCQRWANEKWKHFSENVTYFEDTNTEQHRMNNTAGKAYTHSTLIFDDAKMWFSLLFFFAVGERIYLRTTYGIVCYVFILLCLDFVQSLVLSCFHAWKIGIASNRAVKWEMCSLLLEVNRRINIDRLKEQNASLQIRTHSGTQTETRHH